MTEMTVQGRVKLNASQSKLPRANLLKHLLVHLSY